MKLEIYRQLLHQSSNAAEIQTINKTTDLGSNARNQSPKINM